MRWLLVLVGLFGFVACATAQASEKRVALIIGNDDYQVVRPQLYNAGNDARAMERALRAAGFETSLKVNAKRRELYQLIDAFAGQIAASAETVGLFYYAGHGVQANGTNYLIPVDADVVSEQDLEAEAVDVAKVLRALDQARNRVNIVILDACRDNPLPKGRSLARGLARMDAPHGTFIGYAAAPGQTAEDGPEGGNGVFTGAMVQAIGEPGLPIEQVFKKVIATVLERTGGKQAPWMEASLQGDFYFFAPGAQATIVTPPAPAAPAFDPRQIEMALWNSVKDSKDPAEIQEYLKQYPDGIFAGLARNRLAALKATQPPSPSSSASPTLANNSASPAPDQLRTPPSKPAPSNETTQQLAVVEPPRLAGPKLSASEMYQRGTEEADKGHYKEAMRWYRQSAEMGVPEAMREIGYLYTNGLGTAKDYIEAMRWYRQSADKGYALAMNEVGRLYLHGLGVPTNYSEAMRWYRQAADKGNATAISNIGFLYQHGLGVPTDYGEAMRLYRQAADNGYAGAMNQIGFLYQIGLGVPTNYSEAMRWYRKAADGGVPEAMNSIGGMYAQGQGVAKNCGVARIWFEKAANAGVQSAKDWLRPNTACMALSPV